MHSAIIGTVRSLWTWLWGRYHVLQNVFIRNVYLVSIIISIIAICVCVNLLSDMRVMQFVLFGIL